MASREEGPGVIRLDVLSYEASIEVLEAIEVSFVADEELDGGIGVRWIYIRLVKKKIEGGRSDVPRILEAIESQLPWHACFLPQRHW